jgi:CBS domain containing-hemolysin-like protein
MEVEIGITVVLLIALAFLATIDMAFSQLSDVGLRRLGVESEERPTGEASFLNEIAENRPRFRFTLSAAIQVLLVAMSVLVTSLAIRLFPGRRFTLIAFVVGVALTIAVRQFIPRLVSVRDPERTLLALLPFFRPFYRAMSYLAAPFHRLFDRLRHKHKEIHATAIPDTEEEDAGDDLQVLIDVGAEEGILEEEEGELIHSIIEFGDKRVSGIMTPRTDIVALPITATVKEARDVMLETKYSRLPVYRDQIDNVEGIIYVRDLLQCWAGCRESEPIAPLLRPAYFVPETKEVDQLLEEMQKAHMQLALVIDEYGGLAGLVTVEDILEEIVGEIEDEDTEGDEIVEIIEAGEGYYEVLGSTEIGKIERLFDMEIEDDDFTTIAGLVISELGSVPRPGTRLQFRGLDVEVLEADERRIGRLRLRRAETAAQAGE